MNPEDIPQPPPVPEGIDFTQPTPPPPPPAAKPKRPRAAPKKPDPVAPVPDVLPSDAGSLQAMVAAQAQQIGELMKLVNSGGNPAGVDLSLSPFERARQDEHARIVSIRKRTPEQDANPNIVWIQGQHGRGHYQERQLISGHIPVDLVKETTVPLTNPGPMVRRS